MTPLEAQALYASRYLKKRLRCSGSLSGNVRPALFDEIRTRADGAPGLAAHVAGVRPLKTDCAFMRILAILAL